ncbi:hypothetical protein SAMN05216312_102497 [Cohnella sp. OV330]|uniref:hypothetical protein n=1 Tax=Cohnella sp. OV330 TaxID=1855288 RepID=UPI0008EE84FB|nr:hypothetical protein [Cohnella sp. OV330]SFA95737.1 hypothetical protein SAMN05216312_102497 [Cohnella sp. OV330]
MSFEPEAWKQFVTDHWVLILIAVVALLVILNVVKTVLKWVLAAAIVVGVVVYGGYTVSDLKEIGGQVVETATSAVKDEASKAMAEEAKKATYTLNPDGTYLVKSPNLELTGTPNSGEVDVKFRSVSLGTWKMEGPVRDFVTTALQASK